MSTYNALVINYKFCWSESLNEDLDLLYEENESYAALADAILELIEDSPKVRFELSHGRYRQLNPRFDADVWTTAHRRQLNLYRIKLWATDGELLPFRIIYAVDHRQMSPRICFLGVMAREIDYDIDSDFGRRIQDDYDDLGVPELPRA